jgi:hypothetical protein
MGPLALRLPLQRLSFPRFVSPRSLENRGRKDYLLWWTFKALSWCLAPGTSCGPTARMLSWSLKPARVDFNLLHEPALL